MTAHATGDKQDPSTRRPGTGSAAPEHSLNPLQRLIRQRMRERGWSYGEIARRGGLPRSTVYTLAMTRNLGRPPRPSPPGCTTTMSPRPGARTRATRRGNS